MFGQGVYIKNAYLFLAAYIKTFAPTKAWGT